MSIIDCYSEENNFSKNPTQYKIEVKLNSEEPYSIDRRYSDFYSLHTKLTEHWPGIVIPSIPPKKFIGNKNTAFIKCRKRLLSRFLDKILERSYLLESKEMKQFLQYEGNPQKVIE